MASGWGARWPCALLLLHAAAWVAPALGVAPCDVTEYQPEDSSLCCRLCPAGQYVFRSCRLNHTSSECRVCEPGTFLSYPNGETSCQRCGQCRQGDQEVGAKCTPTSDEQCRCKEGSFYCDSANCLENCLRCKRCPGAVLSPCNSTRDTVCAGETYPGHPGSTGGAPVPVAIVVAVVIVVLVVGSVCCYRRRAKLVSGVRDSYQSVIRLLNKGRSSDGSDSLPLRNNVQLETVHPKAPECDRLASGPVTQPSEDEALMSEARPHPGPSGEPEESPELQAVVVGGSPAPPEQALETAAPAAPGPRNGTQASPSLKSLEERYRTEYFVRDKSQEGITSIFYEFVKTNLGNDWKMFMRLIGLDETDIDSCECENPGNLKEQRHKMLFTWRKKLGKEATVFKLLAALHKLELHMYLQNIINNLVAQNILGRYVENSETSD